MMWVPDSAGIVAGVPVGCLSVACRMRRVAMIDSKLEMLVLDSLVTHKAVGDVQAATCPQL